MIRASRRRAACTLIAIEPVARRAMESLETRLLMSLSQATADNPVVHWLTTESSQDYFVPLSAIPVDSSATAYTRVSEYTPFRVELADLRSQLDSAPMEFVPGAEDPLVLSLPRPDGTVERFEIMESPIMEAGLAAQLPDVKTFRGQGIDDPHANVRLDYTPHGFHAQVLSPNGRYYIDPYYHMEADGAYFSYFQRDAVLSQQFTFFEDDIDHTAGRSSVPPTTGEDPDPELSDVALPFGATLRTFRAAVAATGEYTAFHGGTAALGQAAIVTAMNRVTQVYEYDLAIRMTLVANNINIVYTNAATDPYTNTNPSALLTQNQSNLDNVATIGGSGVYDIGHVFSTGGGGLASLGVVGINGVKVRGETGLPSPIGDGFYIDFVAHEIGHQFGGNHTMNSSSVGGNRNGATAYEPGSGSTIMAYAGVVGGGEDLQSFSDPYFEAVSIDEIRNHILSTVPGVGTNTATGNNPPTVNAGADFTIPALTPFALTATGSDPDSDPVTYDWQQRDLGNADQLTTADDGNGPLFRTWVPATSSTRLLPRLSSILAAVPNNVTNNVSGRPVEKLYAVSRTSNWRVIARDNRVGGGGVSSDDMVLTVVATGAGFLVTSPNTAVNWAGGSTQTVTWNVAGTTGAGINAANVKISLSTNGGLTFATVLHASTANDGSETITLPNINTSTARIKVEAVGNIFFDISNSNFTITAATQSAQPGSPDLEAVTDTGVFSTDNVTNRNNSSGGTTLDFTVSGTVSGALVKVFSDGTLIGSTTAAGTTTTVTTDGATALSHGAHNITATQIESGKTESNPSTALPINVDTVAPTMSSPSDYFYLTAPQKIVYSFSENVQPSLLITDLDLDNTTTATTIASGDMSLGYLSDVATITFTGLADQILPNGNYTATLTGVSDLAGNGLAADVLNFFFLMGDADHNKTVDTVDFNTLASNFSVVGGVDFADADFNYDGTVDTIDFNLLSANFSAFLT